jgi:hypothetical protein
LGERVVTVDSTGDAPPSRAARIDWRLGPDGAGERRSFVAKLYWDARPIEWVVPAIAAATASAVVTCRAQALGLGWSAWQYVVAGFLALNVGFAVAIGTTPVKRYFHQRGDIRGWDLVSLLGDAVFQIALFDWVFVGGRTLGLPGGYTLTLGTYIVGVGLIVLFAPLYIRRALAHLFCLLGMALALYVLPSVPGMEWFPFVVLYKYIASHMPREEAYRPATPA